MTRPTQSLLAPKSAFDQAIALTNSGDLAGAEARCRAALAEYPRDVNMLALLGALLIKLDRAPEAEAKLRQAIGEASTFAKPHEDLRSRSWAADPRRTRLSSGASSCHRNGA